MSATCRLHELLPEISSGALRSQWRVDWDAVRRRIATNPDDVRRPYVRVKNRFGPLITNTTELENKSDVLHQKFYRNVQEVPADAIISSWVLHQLLYRGEQVPADVIVSAVEAFPEALRLPLWRADGVKNDFFLPAVVRSFPLEYACRSGGTLPPDTIRLLAERTCGECENSQDFSFFELFGFVLHMGYDNDAVRAVVNASDTITALLAQKKYLLAEVSNRAGNGTTCKVQEDKGDRHHEELKSKATKIYNAMVDRGLASEAENYKNWHLQERRVCTHLEIFAWNTFINGFRNRHVSFWQISVEDRRLCWERAKIMLSKQGRSVLHAILAQMPQECVTKNTDAWGNLLQCAQVFDPELFQQTNETEDLPLHVFLKTKTWSGGPKSQRGGVLVQIFTKAYPEALKRHDCDGRLPLHLALWNYPNYGAIHELLVVEPRALSTPELREKMHPFQIAWAKYWYESTKRASNGEKDDKIEVFNLTMTYSLIRGDPVSVCHTNASSFVAKIVELEENLRQLKRKADMERPAGAAKRKYEQISVREFLRRID